MVTPVIPRDYRLLKLGIRFLVNCGLSYYKHTCRRPVISAKPVGQIITSKMNLVLTRAKSADHGLLALVIGFLMNCGVFNHRR